MNGSTPLWPKIVLVGVALMLVVGLVELFRARFATGDVYPEYSSHRGDPLGTRVIFEALDSAGVETMRNHRDLARVDPGSGTIYRCGMQWRDFEEATTKDAEALLASVRSGSRLVIAFAPQDPERNKDDALFREIQSRAERRTEPKDREPRVKLTREFGVDARWLPAGQDGRLEATRTGESTLPERFLWHTALAFEPGEDWRRVYDVERFAAVIERDFGDGTIVLVGDAYVLSNEAMVRSRQSALLAWLQGRHRRAVFDETHLGVVENSGIAALARRYGLAHAALALVVVAFLHLWRNGSSLVPSARPGRDDAEELGGRDVSAGLVHLLQRTLPAKELFSACLAEYRHGAPWRRLSPQEQQSLEAINLTSGPGRRGPVESIRAAHELLKRKT